jgi:hypothetical protein
MTHASTLTSTGFYLRIETFQGTGSIRSLTPGGDRSQTAMGFFVILMYCNGLPKFQLSGSNKTHIICASILWFAFTAPPA